LAIGYQNESAERDIVVLRASGVPAPLNPRLTEDGVAVTRSTRTHPDVRQGSSVRGAIDTVLVAAELAALRGISSASDRRYAETFYDAMIVALSGRIHLDEAAETTAERVLREIFEDRFVLEPAAAKPG
jgi:MoxR-like ATPase